MKRASRKKLKQLALIWHSRSDDDERAATYPGYSPVAESLLAYAKVRRNCACELLLNLQELDRAKENPAKAGLVSALQPECESD